VVHNARIVTKPWGQELIFAHTSEYAGKILYVTAGHRLSLQYHEHKHETVYVRRGLIHATVATNDGVLERVTLYPGDTLDVRAGQIHRFEAVEDSELFEVSTPELSDVVRISDDYGR
jgi:mannose-6-phosphate isomerase-like protein (cupin superfamily)